MPQYFDCMRCRTVTELLELPARCEKCGGGTGVVFAKDDAPRAAAVTPAAYARTDSPNGPRSR